MEDQFWDKDRHELRTRANQRFRARHPQRNASSGERRESDSTGRRSAHVKRRDTVSGLATKEILGSDDHDGNREEPNDRAQAIDAMKSWADSNIDWKEKEAGSYRSPLTLPYRSRSSAEKERLARERRRRATIINSRIPVPTLLPHPSWIDDGSSSKIKDGPHHSPKLQPSAFERIESDHNEVSPSLAEKLNRHAEEDYSPKSQKQGRDNDHDSNFQPSDSGCALSDDDQIIRRDLGSWNLSSERESHHVSLPSPQKPDQSIQETSGCENEAVSYKGKRHDEMETLSETPPDPKKYQRHSADSQLKSSGLKPTFINTYPIHDPVENRFDPETNKAEAAETLRSHGFIENVNRDSHPLSPRSEYSLSPKSAPTKDPGPQDDLPGCDKNKTPNTTQNTKTTRVAEYQSLYAQQKPPRREKMQGPDPKSKSPDGKHVKRPNLRLKSPERDHIKNPDQGHYVKDINLEPQHTDSGGVTVKTNPIQDQIGKDDDPEAWLNSDALLVGNYRACFHHSQKPGSPRKDHPTDPGSSNDSLVISPVRSDQSENSEEEEWNSISNANDEIIRIFDEYKANSQLEPTSEEQEVKYWRRAKRAADKNDRRSPSIDSRPSSISTPSSDGSLLLSPDQYNGESQTNAEPGLDDLEQAEEEEEEDEVVEEKEEETNQNLLNLIELHRANYELQKDAEAKEAKFKREIKIAWNRPRPPPTTEEQRLDRVALEDIKSKEIFDELGDQQRPINTDSYLIVRETRIDIMITRARTCFLLEDYRRMYTRANQAVEAASSLKYPPLTARCCYYRGLASYHHGELGSARDDFVEARGCAGLYGITSEGIERYIQLIDSGIDPETAAMLEPSPARTVSRGHKTERPRRAGHTPTDGANRSPPSSAEDATTLVGDAPRSAENPSSLPTTEERSTSSQPAENLDSQTQASPSPNHNHTDALPPPDDDDPPHPATNDTIPTYQPHEEAISEAIRKDILESKAQSLDTANNEADPSSARGPHRTEPPPPPASSLAITEQTLQGSATTTTTTTYPGTTTITRRVPRPHVAPITTSLAITAASSSMRREEGLPQATPRVSDTGNRGGDDEDWGSDEIGSDEVYAAFGGRPEGEGIPDSAKWSDG